MTQKWNLQDIRPVEVRQPRRVVTKEVPHKVINRPNPNFQNHNSEGDEDEVGTIVIKDNKKTNRFNYTLVGVFAVILVGGIFASTAYLSKITLTVFPEFKEPNVNAEFTAYTDRREDALTYEIMTLEQTGERQVKASGQENVESQAKGFLEISKTTPGSERLIKNTRFRSADGLIFRIQESVVVPGAMKDSSGALVPGTIRAEVFADAVGSEYNLPVGAKFDVPGFKDSNLTELYNSIKAENREPLAGGFKGPKFMIDDNELSTAKQSLQMELRDSLLTKIESEKPADFVVFKDAVAITYNDLPTVQYGDDLVTIKVQAVLQLPLFKYADFSSFIAKETIPTYSQDPVRIRNTDDLKFSYTDSNTGTTNIANAPSLTFNIVGKPLIVWEYSAEQLQKDLAGKQMTAISTVLSGYTGIKNASITGKPFWARSFPDEPSEINIIESIDKK
jgi:hypothetical protein